MPYYASTTHMEGKKSVSIIIPATDEVRSLQKTVEEIETLLLDRELQVLIVTHGRLTTPECRNMIDSLRVKYPEIETFVQQTPGIGGALRDSFKRCTKDCAVIMSADLETDPAILPAMLLAIESGVDVVATTRWRGGARFTGYSPIKLVLNFLFQRTFRVLYRTDLTDLTYAYRVYRADVLKRIHWEETGFPFLLESILKPLLLGYRIIEIEAPWHARSEGASHNSFAQTAFYTWTGLRLRFQARNKMLYSEAQ